MKQTIILISAIAGLLSCAKGPVISQEETGVPMNFNISVTETKAAKNTWANGDKVYVLFKGLATKYLILSYNGSEWTNTSGGGTLLDSDFSGLNPKTLTAVHFPVEVDVAYADSKFSFTSGGKPVYNYYLFEAGKAYTVSGTTVNASLSMGKPADMVQIHVPGIQESVGDYTFGCSKIKPVACASVGFDGAITESVLQAGVRVSGVADSDGGIFAGRLVYPGELKDYKFTVASDDKIYTLTRASKALTAGTLYNFPSLSTTGGSNWAEQNAFDLYVDLGLSVKWSSTNLGATSPSDYGDYFSWGETTPKDIYSWSTYELCNGSSYTLTKYNNNTSYGAVDNKSEFKHYGYEDDAARQALGGKWRIPTDEEWTELRENCDWTPATRNGIKGYEVKSTKTGNNNSIFLPAAGYREEKDGQDILTNEGDEGCYWSSTLYEADAARSAFFNSDMVYRYEYSRCYGLSIRPVSE